MKIMVWGFPMPCCSLCGPCLPKNRVLPILAWDWHIVGSGLCDRGRGAGQHTHHRLDICCFAWIDPLPVNYCFSPALGFQPTDLKLFTAVIVTVALISPFFKGYTEKIKGKFRSYKEKVKEKFKTGDEDLGKEEVYPAGGI